MRRASSTRGDANCFRQYDTAATVETIRIMDLGIVGKGEEVSVKAITDTNTSAAKKSFISPPYVHPMNQMIVMIH